MRISKTIRRAAKRLFTDCFDQGALNETKARTVIAALVHDKPRGYIGLLTHFRHLLRLYFEKQKASIESVDPLSPAFDSRLKQALSSRYGPGLDFHQETNPALIGGVRIKVGSDVYDGSIRARLDSLKEAFE